MQYMTYQNIIKSGQDGDIVFLKGRWTNITEALIMIATQSSFTHCVILFHTDIGNQLYCMVVEAQGGTKRRIVPLDVYNQRSFVLVSAPKLWNEVSANALSNVGTEGYGWLQAIQVGLRDILKRCFKITLPSKDFDHEICSEFIAKVYGLTDPDISPQDLYAVLTQH